MAQFLTIVLCFRSGVSLSSRRQASTGLGSAVSSLLPSASARRPGGLRLLYMFFNDAFVADLHDDYGCGFRSGVVSWTCSNSSSSSIPLSLWVLQVCFYFSILALAFQVLFQNHFCQSLNREISAFHNFISVKKTRLYSALPQVCHFTWLHFVACCPFQSLSDSLSQTFLALEFPSPCHSPSWRELMRKGLNL